MVRRLKGELNLDWDSKFSDLNLDLILNLVLLPKNFKMENHENHAPRAIARIKYRDSCTGMTNAAAWHLPAKFMIPIRLYGDIEVITGMELAPAQNIPDQVCIYYYGSGWKLTSRSILPDLGILYPLSTAIQLDYTAPTGKHLCTQDRGAETAASDRERW